MKSETARHPDLDEETGNCHNCGAGVSYHYCAVCGQETKLHVASAREFLHEFVGHYVALEGKLWHSLWLLMMRPGALTAEYIAGRRARYVQPLRIYLTFSILFFALIKYTGSDLTLVQQTEAEKKAAAAEISRGNVARAGGGGVPTTLPRRDDVQLKTNLGELNPAWEARLRQIWSLPEAERTKLLQYAFFSYVPYAVFALMPLFAFYLKLLYLGTGRRYGEHFLFALHANAFAFLMFGLIYIVPTELARVAMAVWLMSYLPLAMRRVYGGSVLATAARWSALMLVHLCSIFSAIALTLFLALIV
ncbi:DUF3667 domain-containing protein [Massilia glaciei]|uniref:DUF3667 domain-containing protein n=1 Tax=Massilia glaciei TaxID=1524097 RepID=A0A2U2HDS5_9BURK|nr:DUF3667 domain-containing protein [Massilia glaciei]PWF41330.1 DUF3667 domain-containing protein [Massilia glaciei]